MRGIFESLIVFGIMTGILLPVRLLFVEYVSDSWLGSLGIISVISILIIVLAKRKKLGFFGHMFERQMYKFQKGKRGILVFGESLMVLSILGLMIFAIDQGNTVYSDLKPQLAATSVPENSEQLLEVYKGWDASDWFLGFLMAPVGFLTAFPQMSSAMASIDHSMDGWILHFYTVGFVEYLELFGIFIFYRISFKRKFTSSIISSSYAKSAV